MLNVFTRPISSNKREALDPMFQFYAGQWVKLVNNKVSIAGPTDIGLEQVYMGNLKYVKGVFRTIYGLYEGLTDQYNKEVNYEIDANLTVRNGILDLAIEGEHVVAIFMGIEENSLHFKRV